MHRENVQTLHSEIRQMFNSSPLCWHASEWLSYHTAHFAAKWGLKRAFLVKGEFIILTFVDFFEFLKVYFEFNTRGNSFSCLIAYFCNNINLWKNPYVYSVLLMFSTYFFFCFPPNFRLYSRRASLYSFLLFFPCLFCAPFSTIFNALIIPLLPPYFFFHHSLCSPLSLPAPGHLLFSSLIQPFGIKRI